MEPDAKLRRLLPSPDGIYAKALDALVAERDSLRNQRDQLQRERDAAWKTGEAAHLAGRHLQARAHAAEARAEALATWILVNCGPAALTAARPEREGEK